MRLDHKEPERRKIVRHVKRLDWLANPNVIDRMDLSQLREVVKHQARLIKLLVERELSDH